jgi:hypothetical protein
MFESLMRFRTVAELEGSAGYWKLGQASRPLVRISYKSYDSSTFRLSNTYSPCGLTWLTQRVSSSRGRLPT